MQAVHCSLLILMATLTLWTATKDFQETLTSGVQLDNYTQVVDPLKQENVPRYTNKIAQWQLIRQQYLYLQKLSNQINEAIGPNVTFCILETILYYAISLDEVVKHGDYNKVAEALYFLFELVYICIIVLFAADIPHKVINTSVLKSRCIELIF